MKWPPFYVRLSSIKFYLLRPPPPERAPDERLGLEERDDPIDLDTVDLFDELVALDLFDELGDVNLLDVDGLLDALLEVDAPFLVRPACDFDWFVDARLEVDAPFEERPVCEVEGRDPPWPAVLKFPFLTLLFTVLEVFLLFLL